MKHMILRASLSSVFAILVANLVVAAEGENMPVKTLEVKNTTEKLEVTASQIGFRDTLIFYTFKDLKAVLKLQIDNKDKTFPMTGTVYLFAENVDGEGLSKWLNNQHSDGLYPEVPVPITTQKIPAGVCKVTSNKFIEPVKQPFGEYDSYAVTFAVADATDKKTYAVKGFTGMTRVYVKTK